MKIKKKWLCVLFMSLLCIVYSTTIYGEELDGNSGDKTQAPYFYIEGGDPTVDSFPLKGTEVTTNINGTIAETFVVQTYANLGTSPINASYVFPASSRVTVHGMTMQIGDKTVTAQIKEKEEAKQEFEEAKSEGKSASLLEQQRPNVFTMDVANVMPGDIVRIELHYTEMIVSTEGTYQFVFPTVAGPRYASLSGALEAPADDWVTSPYITDNDMPDKKYDIHVNLSTGVPITDLASKSHDISVTWNNQTAAQVALSNPDDFAGNKDFILEYKLTGDEVNCGIMLDKGEDENFFMLMVQPPERIQLEDIPPREYVFLLDVSGSMNGYPLDTAKDLITNLVTNLRETDKFNLILFSGASVQMAPRSVSATQANIKSAIHLIDEQEGGGGTELASALKDAISLPKEEDASRSIVLITDGYISGEKEVFDIINKNIGTTNFFSFGIGSSVNRYLIDGVANTGLGESFVVTDSSDAAETAERFRTYIQSPVLTDIKVTYDGFDVYDVEPPVLSTLFAQRPIVLFGKWRGEAVGTIRITGKSGNQDYAQDIKVSEIKPLEVNKAIRYLWARTKVERLVDFGSPDDEEAVKKEITALGLKYSMMTPYTSFIAVIDIVRNPDKKSTDVKQPLLLPENVSELAVGDGYTVGSEPSDMILVLGMLFLIGTGAAVRKGRKGRRPQGA